MIIREGISIQGGMGVIVSQCDRYIGDICLNRVSTKSDIADIFQGCQITKYRLTFCLRHLDTPRNFRNIQHIRKVNLQLRHVDC